MGGLWLLSQPTRFKNATTSAMWISVKLATNVEMTENVSKRPRKPKKSATVNAETLVKLAMMSAEKHLSMKRKNAATMPNASNRPNDTTKNVTKNATTTDLPDHLTRKQPLSKSAALMVATKKLKLLQRNAMATKPA